MMAHVSRLPTKEAQYPLIKEYALDDRSIPNMIQDMFLS